jgi:hypothetical protein
VEYGYRCELREFCKTTESEKLGLLISAAADAGFATHFTKQTDAWLLEVRLLQRTVAKLIAKLPKSETWSLLLEYEIPRREKRPDVVLLADDLIFVVEFKFGAISFTGDAEWQVVSYALDLRDFHLASNNRTILPVLVATSATSSDGPLLLDTLSNANAVVQVQRTAGNGGEALAMCIASSYLKFHREEAQPIDPSAWASAAYRPCPGIIEAAETLFAGHQVDDISHAFAHNLTDTTDAIANAIESSHLNSERTICFITGIPGAGKTLAGLKSVHDPRLRAHGRAATTFLSGNGPLVKIVREALVRDRVRSGMKASDASRTVSTLVSNVHGFLVKYGIRNPEQVPYENSIVFDEAQRAWDAEAVQKKHGINKSEPELVLEIMERAENWCTVIVLIGSGQEIHKGEAGLGAWGEALNSRKSQWRVLASSEVLLGGGSVAGQKLFATKPASHLRLNESDSLHLSVGVRSPRARRIGQWVNNLVSGDKQDDIRETILSTEFPVVLTRDLSTAREWLRMHSDGTQRSGLLASSGALRLRSYGIEVSSGFRKGYSYVEWFLRGREDFRSSSALEVAATEFECQGLELDWSRVCWGGDFLFCSNKCSWQFRKLLGSKWRQVKQDKDRQYISNKYRVLLTRARRGMAIWIPRGEASDETQDPHALDATAEYIQSQGIALI